VRLGWAPSRRVACALIEDGRVRVNGRRQRKGALIAANDQVEVTSPAESIAKESVPESKVTLEIMHENEGLLIVNKPALLPCHPLNPPDEASVITLLARDYPEVYPGVFAEDEALCAKPLEGGLIHRLDNGTSGALMVARTRETLRFMREALRAGHIYRRYEALIASSLDNAIELNWPIAHHRKNPARMVIVDDLPLPTIASRGEKIVRAPYRGTPREAFSFVEPVAQAGGFTLVNVIPRTGRRHQIRVHLAAAGTPIANDKLYGGAPLPPLPEGRFWLHLAELRFDFLSGQTLRILAPRPKDLLDSLIHIRMQPDAVVSRARKSGRAGPGIAPVIADRHLT
jgi:23S rRNA pseudouridine1911/1915/1917 synthase